MTTNIKATLPRRNRGRRSIDESQRTRDQILVSAVNMFCETGYEATSIRKISKDSTVTHSCVLYHFGSKDKLWLEAGQYLNSYLSEEVKRLMAYLVNEKCSKRKIYLFSIHIMALLLRYSFPIKYMLEAIRYRDVLDKQFGDIAYKVILPILNQIDLMSPVSDERLFNLKWILISGCCAGVNLKLLSDKVDSLKTKIAEVQHLSLYNTIIARYCDINSSDLISTNEVDNLIIYLSHPLRNI